MSSLPVDILLVEDNPGDARLLEEHLRDAPLLVGMVERVARLDAVAAQLERRRPDVVLLDLSLPDAHGMETVRKALAVASDLPIVVLTGLDDEYLAVQAVQAGAQDYLVKGQLEPVLLARSIRYAVERKHLERERLRLLALEKEARSLAEAAVRTRDQVLQVFSHDIGNQLAAIQLYTAMLLRRVPADASWLQPRAWAIAISELTTELQQLRESILDAAQIEAGRLSVELRSVDVRELLDSLGTQMRPLAQEKGVVLEVASGPDLPAVRADRERILQALGNMIGNAIKFTPGGGTVSLRAEAVDRELRVAVADTGPGIAPEDLPLIFETFWKTRAGNPHGSGLGLGIASRIAELHGGRILVESELGRGTVFTVALPVAETDDPAQPSGR